MAETPPIFFWRQNRFESAPEKNAYFLRIFGRNLAEIVGKKGGFGQRYQII